MGLQLSTFVAESAKLPDLPEDQLVDVLRTSGAGLSTDQAETVEAPMLSTSSFKVRNAAAIALLDARYPRLETAINEVLAHSAIAKSAGTLLFCLMEANLRLAASVLPNLIQHGSYEARSELLILTSGGSISFEKDADLDDLRAALTDLTQSADNEAAEVAALALEDVQALRST